ncbi:MAG TPA: ABC transporter ATP-binding protein [Chloroflexia bacterium]|nr:ABC transporter ATP-binding protein [Chloroflexia bacterium]
MKPSNQPTSAVTPNGPEEQGEALLALEGVHTYIGQFHILQGIDLKVRQGAVTVLLGRNGAGKTTTMKTIMGLTPAREGKLTYQGHTLNNETTYEIARHGIGYVPEDRGIFREMTVEENLLLAARGEKASEYRRRLEFCLDLFPDMRRFTRQKAGTLSGGQQQMVAISRGLMTDNKLLLIDEPSKGLAPIVVKAVMDALEKLKEHITILLVEQNFTMASTVGDYFYLIDDGHNIVDGPMAQLISDKDLQHKYMGVGAV